MNCFAPTGEPDHPLRSIELLYEQTGERIPALQAIYKSYIILILRGSAAPEPENRPKGATREPETEKFENFINLKNHYFLNGLDTARSRLPANGST